MRLSENKRQKKYTKRQNIRITQNSILYAFIIHYIRYCLCVRKTIENWYKMYKFSLKKYKPKCCEALFMRGWCMATGTEEEKKSRSINSCYAYYIFN